MIVYPLMIMIILNHRNFYRIFKRWDLHLNHHHVHLVLIQLMILIYFHPRRNPIQISSITDHCLPVSFSAANCSNDFSI